MVEEMLTILREIPDPRDFTVQYDLGETLFLALCGIVCGEKTCVDIADFASAHEAEFREVLTLRNGTPSHDTLSRILRLLAPHAVEAALTACLSAMGQHLRAGRVLAVDGKALRGAYTAGQSHMPPVMVGVFDSYTRLSLSHGRAEAGGEAQTARSLLQAIVPKGCTVTADALHCRPDTAAVIRGAGAHYVIGLKANQPTLHAAAEAAFARAPEPRPGDTTREVGHGRVVQRTVGVATAPAEAKARLPGLAAFGRIVSVRQVAGHPEEHHTRYFVLSRRLTPSRLALLTRAHWAIENHLHGTLDVVFCEDDARTCKDYGPENLAALRRLARNILEAHPSDRPIRKKMKLASWSKDYLFELFTHVR